MRISHMRHKQVYWWLAWFVVLKPVRNTFVLLMIRRDH